jgi:hypothetical protein
MNRNPDVELVLRAYLADDGDVAPDRVLEVVADRIARQARRPASRLPWRPFMNTYAKLAAAAAAVLIVGVVGWQLLPGLGGPGGGPSPVPSPSSTPVATPILTPAPTVSAPPPLPDGILGAGTYRLRPFLTTTMTIDATVPGGGWVGGVPGAIGGPRGDSNGPNGVAVAFLKAQTIHSDPCHWDQDGNGSAPDLGDVEVGPTVDDLVEALAASSAYESTPAVDATLGGFTGKRLELQLVPDDSGCDTFDGDENQYFVFGGSEGGQFAQGGANRWQVTIVDVEGTRLISVLLSYAETLGGDVTAAQTILDSVVITP